MALRRLVFCLTFALPLVACMSWGKFWASFQVTGISPDNSGQVWGINPVVMISFSEAVNPSTVTANTFPTTSCAGSVQVSSDDFVTCVMMSSSGGTVSNGNQTITFTPVNMYGLKPFKIKATAAIQSASGISLTEFTATALIYTTGVMYANQNAGTTVVQFTVNPLTGAVNSNGSIAANTSPRGIIFSPDGRFVFVGVSGNSVYGYGVSANGTLNPINNQALVSVTITEGLAMHPSGKYFYAVGGGSSNIGLLNFDAATGVIAAHAGTLGADRFNAPGAGPLKGTVTADGAYFLLANNGTNQVAVFAVAQATGVLAAPNTVTAGSSPGDVCVNKAGTRVFSAQGSAGIAASFTLTAGNLVTVGNYGVAVSTYLGCALSLDDKFFYAADNSTSFLRYLSIAADGTMADAGSVSTGSSAAHGMAIDRNGKYLFVTGSSGNSISVFSLNTTTGAPTLLANPTAGAAPRYVAVY